MIPFSHICQRNCDAHPNRWTRFTRDEQLTLMSLWALAASPLMLGMNLPDNDDWTTAIISNPEVLSVNQDSAGKPARRLAGPAQTDETWVKPLADGSLAVGFFNRADRPVKVDWAWRNLGFRFAPKVRDLWMRKDLGRQNKFVTELVPRGCALLRVK
jgi:alpha-galactosidase